MHHTTGRPQGYNVVHFVADGSDCHRHREKLLRLLIEEKADIQGKALNKKANTPAGLAFGQGASDLGEFLLNAHADQSATNSLGKGLLQLAAGCSSTCASLLRAQNAPETFSRKSGGTRITEGGSSRQHRKARWLSAQQQGSQH